MVDVFLIIAVVVMAILVLGGMILLVIIFGHPDDKNTAWFPKIVIVAGLWMAFASLLILPYDVANSKGDGGGVRVDILWLIVYITLAIFVAFLVPFAFFFYESDMDDEDKPESCCDSQAGQAIKYTLGLAVVFVVLLVIMYSQLNIASIPVRRFTQAIDLFMPVVPETGYYQTFASMNKKNNGTTCVYNNYIDSLVTEMCIASIVYWDIPVTFPLYILAFMAFLGWFFFTIFVGVGFFALPLDLINEYRTRPTPISTKVYFEERQSLGMRAKQLLQIAEKLQLALEKSGQSRSQRRQNTRDMRAFEKHYYYLKKDYQVLYIAHKLKGGNPLVYIGKLILGLISICISIAWFIHIAIFILPARPYHPFLNDFFIKLEEGIPGFSLFGVLAFAIFSFYLLWATIKGNFRLGVRFLVWKIYPMEAGNTLMNAFLVNTWIIMLCSLPAVQFSVTAFPIYARSTQADVMFGQQVRFLKFFRLFFTNNVFIIAMLCISALTILVLVVCPVNKAEEIEGQLDRIAKSSSTSLHDDLED